MSEQKHEEGLQVKYPEAIVGGVYCNNMLVTHTREEFIMDFMMVAPPVGSVTARVIMSPGHMKRTIAALQENLKRYEDKFGKVQQAPEPATKQKLGFQTP